MIGQCLRCVRGVEVNEATLGVDVMKDVCLGGPGHYLGHDQTIGLMQTEYVYPAIGDRSSPKEWEELGKPNIVEVASKRKEEILASFNPTHISAALDTEIHKNFNVLM
jgi:trimethylamine--corrinoid protein Co-methyltransferase